MAGRMFVPMMSGSSLSMMPDTVRFRIRPSLNSCVSILPLAEELSDFQIPEFDSNSALFRTLHILCKKERPVLRTVMTVCLH